MIKVTEDTILKPLVIEDARDVFNILDSEREYMRVWLPFVDSTKEIQDTEDAIVSITCKPDETYAINYKNKLVGLIGLKETDNVTRKTEIGYWLSQSAQGNGIITNSVNCLLKHAFENLNINRVQIKAAVNNMASRRIPERLGFQQEGIERDGELLVDDIYTDIVVYSILQREYIEKTENADIKIS